MNTKKKFAIVLGALALIIVSGVLILKPSVNADEKDINTIKEEIKQELKEELNAEYTVKFEEIKKEQQEKIDELNKKLDSKEAEIKALITAGDNAVEKKINYNTMNEKAQKQREESNYVPEEPPVIKRTEP
ncbi:hypothetical protein [Clostridium sp. LP20]|uniref:hypothetical protein n=1 Tax=Clostridium sp. LP20 TaxID=3418665 RepID=UPI003EE58933